MSVFGRPTRQPNPECRDCSGTGAVTDPNGPTSNHLRLLPCWCIGLRLDGDR